MPEEHRQDPQDKQFGASAARDAQTVDALEERGVEPAGEPPARPPRAGAKAEPVAGDAAQGAVRPAE